MGRASTWAKLAALTVALGLGGVVANAAAPGDGSGSGNAAAPFAGAAGTDGGGGLFGVGFQSSEMQGSLLGTPGLWTSQFAETLAPGQVSSGAYASRYTRNPGAMVFTDFDFGWTVGVTSRLELSFATTPSRRARLNSPLETAGTNPNPESPFSAGPLERGPVDYDFGLTYNLLSQDRGNAFGLALQAFEHLPYQHGYSALNIAGVTTGEPVFQESALIDKWVGNSELVANLGYQHTSPVDADGLIYLPIRDEFTWDFGVEIPRQARMQAIVELGGDTPFGAGPIPHTNYYGPTSAIDSTWGARLNPTSWMGLNAAYRLDDSQPHANASGFVFGLSFGPPPTPPAPIPHDYSTPSAACRVSDSNVLVGASVQVTATVTPTTVTWADSPSPATIHYTYTWTTTGGRLAPAQDHAALDTTGLAPGMYTVTVKVTTPDGKNGDCNSQVEVRVPVHHPPTATCSATPSSTNPGGSITLQATGTSVDNTAITAYSWQVSGGLTAHLDNSSQATAHLDTTGVNPGNYNATATVTDANGLTATCSPASFQVIAPPAAPAPQLINSIDFAANSSRVDNKAKAALDDYALLLERNPDARGVIVGYATPSERARARALTPAATTKLAEERAVNAKAYLVEIDHVAADRLEVRQDVLSPMKADLWEVPAPQAAPYSGAGETFDESGVKATKPTPAPRAGGGQ